jgi:ComF family protein
MCGRCLQAPPVHGVVTSGVTYGQVAKTIALKLKHGRRVGLAETIGHLLAPRVAAAPPSILIPVPLHRWRLWSRGFNQSVLIAQAVARRSQHRVEQHLLKRAKATPLLRGLGAKDRAKAVQGAFAVDKKARDLLKGQRVILVDDVYTSGATANACAKALKRAGASEVLVLCWARVLAGDQDAY